MKIITKMFRSMFAILFMNLFEGRSGFCDNLADGHSLYGINRSACISEFEGEWHNHDVNFENIYQSLVSLFILSTLEGWPDYMYHIIDGGSEETGPIFENQPWVRYIFIVFIFIGSIFSINLYVAIISMKFD